jgi:hypothetical protein
MANSNTTSGGISLSMVLFIVFLVLKLTNNIDWSWWWVTCPLWGGFLIAISLFIVIFLGLWIGELIKKYF